MTPYRWWLLLWLGLGAMQSPNAGEIPALDMSWYSVPLQHILFNTLDSQILADFSGFGP